MAPTLNGYLTLHSKTGLMKSYKSKWFVYSDETGKLLYYKSREDLIPEGEILITHAIFTFDAKQKPGLFNIQVKDTIYTLEADDRDEMLTWLQELQTRRKEVTGKLNARNKLAEKSLPSESSTQKGNGDESADSDEIPKIALSNGSQLKSTKPASSYKLTTNVSKAADSAKQKLSSMFQRRSHHSDDMTPCADCRKMETELYLAREEAMIAHEELSANQKVLRMLHDNMDLLQQQIRTLENVKQVYDSPETVLELERQKEQNKLLQMISILKKENEKLTALNQSMEADLSTTKDCKEMLEETIQAKDNIIMALSSQLENTQDAEASATPALPPKDLIDFTESYHDTLKTKLEAFELQNKFLNKEILELHYVRLDDELRWDDLNTSYVELKAKYYQLHSKYLLVLNEVNKPKVDEKTGDVEPTDEVVASLLDEAMESTERAEVRESLSNSLSLRKRKYDSYGFEVEGWADDIVVKAEGLQSKYEQLVSKLHETPEAVSLRVKWENFMALVGSSDAKIQRSVEFKTLVRAGIPKEYREKVWNVLVDYHVSCVRNTEDPDYYQQLLKRHSNTKPNLITKQIELDLRRTLPNNKYFEDDNSEGIAKLRRILLAYSMHNPNVGYCQGMNRLAAFSLLFLKEENAFWCLVAIIDKIMGEDYFSATMMTAQADQRVLRDILVEKVPRVVTHLDNLEMDISLFSFNWFITLFIDNIPIPTVLRIWDAFLFEGVKVLFRFATAIFKHNEERILKCTDYITANQFLRDMGKKLTDVERINYIAFNSVNPFPIRSINTKRATHLEQVKAELKELKALRDEFRSQRTGQTGYSVVLDDEEEAES